MIEFGPVLILLNLKVIVEENKKTMETYNYILIIVALAIAYVVISRKVKFKNKNKALPNIIYRVLTIVYPKSSRKALVYQEINRQRSLISAKPLKVDKLTDRLADRRCNEVDEMNELSHVGVSDEFILLKTKGADGTGETLSYGYGTAKGVVNGWMNSKGHQDAILNPKYDWVGIGNKLDENNRWIDCALFGYEK